MPDVNVALIGHGFMGKAHSNAWRQVAAYFPVRLTPRLKVLCGRNRDATDAAARTYGWDECATDWRDVVTRPDIDIVDICTPGSSHAEMAVAAAKAGKAVLCEKPLANSVRDAERMLAAATRAGVLHMVCHNYRRVPAVVLAAQLVREGRLGTIRHFRGTYLQESAHTPDAPMRWRLDRTIAGSGALGDLGSHVVDLARLLAGEIAEVSGTLATFVTSRAWPGQRRRVPVTVDDAVVAAVRFAGGAIGSLEATRAAAGRKNGLRFEVNGTLGSLAFDLERLNELQVYFDADPPAERGFRTIIMTDKTHPYMRAWWSAGHIVGWEHTFIHTVSDLLDALADGAVPSPSFEDGVRNQRVLDAIERSSRTRRWVRVKGVS